MQTAGDGSRNYQPADPVTFLHGKEYGSIQASVMFTHVTSPLILRRGGEAGHPRFRMLHCAVPFVCKLHAVRDPEISSLGGITRFLGWKQSDNVSVMAAAAGPY